MLLLKSLVICDEEGWQFKQVVKAFMKPVLENYLTSSEESTSVKIVSVMKTILLEKARNYRSNNSRQSSNDHQSNNDDINFGEAELDTVRSENPICSSDDEEEK